MGLFSTKPNNPNELNSFSKPKYPPGQYTTEKFPVLTYGVTPKISLSEWRLKIWGLVDENIAFTWEQFMKLPQTKLQADFHCVTTWSRYGDVWEGVLYKDLHTALKVREEARFVMQHAYGGYTTNLPLKWMLEEDVLFAHTFNGKPLEAEHGGPMRVFTPRRYAWKGAKWVSGLEFLKADRRGFWEQNGYSNTADPWNEERYG
jgi:DMSO/TMAO reductase YedYZ molybdopterin-dependent catalytic subunit